MKRRHGERGGRNREGTISTDMVRLLLGGAPVPNTELAEILTAAGLDPAVLDCAQARVSQRQMAMVWNAMEEAAADPYLGLHLGELPDGLPAGHVLFSAMRNCPTLGRALERFCRFHDLMADFVQLRLTVGGESWTLQLLSRGPTLHRQHVECMLSLVVAVLKRLSMSPVQPSVRFAHPEPADIAEYHRVFGKTVRFGQPVNEIALQQELLSRALPVADEEFLEVLDRYAELLLRRLRPTRTWTLRVADLLSRTLCDGNPGLERVARRLAVSKRTLQARLRDEGTSYQAVLDATRQEFATARLEEAELSLAEIAFLAGFSDQSAFSHAFRKWTGETPQRFRDKRRAR